jgi:hypothetical protein
MSVRSVWRVAAALALAMLTSACGDASTAPPRSGDEIVVISVVGVGADAAGVVLRLSGDVEGIEAAHRALGVAWAADDSATATVAVLGAVAEFNELLIVRRRAAAPALSVQVVDVTDGDGVLSISTTAHVVITGGT